MTLGNLSKRLEDLHVEVRALKIALADDRVPAHAKGVILLMVGYALSPTDLIPDFIPVVGQIDDMVIVPVGFTLAWRLVPGDVRREIRKRAEEQVRDAEPASGLFLSVLAALWMFISYAVFALLADD